MTVSRFLVSPRLLLLIAALTVGGPVVAQTGAEGPPEEVGTSLLDLVSEGGWAMYPLGCLMLFTFYLTFHCWAQTNRKRFLPANLEAARESLRQSELTKASERLRSSDTVLGRLAALALTKARPGLKDGNRPAMEAAFVEAAEGEENAVSQWVNYLNVIATVAPMVGLLGTVSGMIGAFQKIGQGGMGKPEELAGNIGEALITTATGLVIGIPAMVAYFYFRNRLTSQMIAVGQAGGALLDELESEQSEAFPPSPSGDASLDRPSAKGAAP